MVTVQQMAEILNVHPNTVINLIKKGMPSYKIGKSRRIDEVEAINWVKEMYKDGGVDNGGLD